LRRLPDPLVIPALGLIAGICLARMSEFGRAELAGLAVLFLGLYWLASRKALRAGAAASGFCFFAVVGVAVDLFQRPPPPPRLNIDSGELAIVEGCVVEPPVFHEDREQFVVELDRDARMRITVYLKENEAPPRLHYGQRVEAEVRVRYPRNFENPGSFDYTGWLARRHIYWTASASGTSRIQVLPGACGDGWRSWLYRVRQGGLERLDELHSTSEYANGVARALLLGDSSRLERVWIEEFRRSGTYHALVISGLHLTALAAVLLFAMRLVSAGPLVRLLVVASAGWFYALICGAAPPVVRAAAGLTLFLFGRYLYRRPRIVNLLAFIAIVFLVLDPQQLFEASFQLSFLAVALIGGVAIPLLERTSLPYSRAVRHLRDEAADPRQPPKAAAFRVELRLLAATLFAWTRLPVRVWLSVFALLTRAALLVWDLFVVSLVVQLGMALPMVVYFHRISISSVSANLGMGLLTGLIVPLGYLELLTGWRWVAAVLEAVLSAARWVAATHAAWEPLWRIPDPPLWVGLLCVAGMVSVALAIRASWRWRAPALALFLSGLTILLWHPFAPLVPAGQLELSAIDVGQGDSLLLATPEGRLVVVDGGGIPSFGRRKAKLDPGEDIVSTYLWSRSIRRVDVIAATHAHEDHTGGLAALMRNFQPRELWVPRPATAEGWRSLKELAAGLGIAIRERYAGEEFEWGGSRWRILSPPRDHVPTPRSGNDDSLVFQVFHGRQSFLLTGDAERAMEWRMVDEGRLSRAGVLKVAHHGSRTSTTAEFLEQVRPAFAVISNGFQNSYRFPHPDVLERLEKAGTRILRTDLDGLVQFRTDGYRIEIRTGRASAERQRRLSFQPAF
jgi:competence protein ComEC